MAVRIDASGDYIRRTASLPANDPVTIMGWVYLVADRNAVGTIFTLDDGVGSGIMVGVGSDGTTLRCGTYVATVGNFVNGTNLSTGTWYHIARVRNGSAQKVYLNGVVDSSETRACSFTAAALYAGNDGASQWVSARLSALKIWTAELTIEEIVNEMRTIAPRRMANMYNWSPTFFGATERLADYSGNGRTWTAGGTLTDEANPPISWGGSPKYFFLSNGTLYYQSVSGGITPAGVLVLQTNKVLTGGLSPAGTIAKSTSKAFTGAVATITGALANQPRKPLTGSVSSIVGTLANRPGKVLTGAVSSITGALLNRTNKTFTGSVSSIVGVLINQPRKVLSGGITPAGTLTAIKTVLLSLTGSVASIVGTLTKQPRKVFTGGVTPTATLINRANKVLSGGITPSGTVSAIKTVLLSLTGSISSISGSLVIRTNKVLTGAVSSIVGTLTKRVNKVLSGGITPSGVESGIKTSLLTLTGSMSSIVGTLVKRTGKVLTGGITPAGAETSKPAKAFTGAVSSITGGLVKQTNKVLSGGITPTGTARAFATKALAGTVASAGSLVNAARKTLSGVIASLGDLVPQLLSLIPLIDYDPDVYASPRRNNTLEDTRTNSEFVSSRENEVYSVKRK